MDTAELEYLIAYEHRGYDDHHLYLLCCHSEEDRRRMRSVLNERGHMIRLDVPVSDLDPDTQRRLRNGTERGRLQAALRSRAREAERSSPNEHQATDDPELPF